MINTQEAILFYQENAANVRYFGLTHLADREERILFRAGRDALAAQAAAEAAANKPSAVSLSNEQFVFIIEAYVSGGSRISIAESFRKAYPNCEVPGSSLNRYVAMLEVTDPAHPCSDLMRCNKRLVTLAQALYPNTFC